MTRESGSMPFHTARERVQLKIPALCLFTLHVCRSESLTSSYKFIPYRSVENVYLLFHMSMRCNSQSKHLLDKIWVHCSVVCFSTISIIQVYSQFKSVRAHKFRPTSQNTAIVRQPNIKTDKISMPVKPFYMWSKKS